MKHVIFLLLFLNPLVITAKPLTICGASFPPSTIVENDQIVSGYSFDLINEAFSRLERQYRLEVLPWKRCLQMVKSGLIDAVIDTSRYNEPILTGDFPISYNQIAVYVRKDFYDVEYSAEYFEDKVIAIPRGYTSYFNIAQKFGWTVFEADDEENMFNMLQKKRFDYALSDTSSASNMAKKVNAKVKHLWPVITSQKYFLGFSPNNMQLLNEFDGVLKEMMQEGALDKIYSKYLSHTYTEMYRHSIRVSDE